MQPDYQRHNNGSLVFVGEKGDLGRSVHFSVGRRHQMMIGQDACDPTSQVDGITWCFSEC
jgi:hypothetical protein